MKLDLTSKEAFEESIKLLNFIGFQQCIEEHRELIPEGIDLVISDSFTSDNHYELLKSILKKKSDYEQWEKRIIKGAYKSCYKRLSF